MLCRSQFNTLRPRQNARHFTDDIFKCISLNEDIKISIIISLNCVHTGRKGNIPALAQIMPWRHEILVMDHFLSVEAERHYSMVESN